MITVTVTASDGTTATVTLDPSGTAAYDSAVFDRSVYG
jgi:hypothetical protein